MFSVLENTLRRRRAGKPSRRNCKPNSKRPDKLEEGAQVRRKFQIDQRGMGAKRDMMLDMTNDLLADRGGGAVGKHWVDNFKKRTPEVKL